MKRAVGYGLVLLVASTTATRSALAWVNGDADVASADVSAQFFLSNGATTTRKPMLEPRSLSGKQ